MDRRSFLGSVGLGAVGLGIPSLAFGAPDDGSGFISNSIRALQGAPVPSFARGRSVDATSLFVTQGHQVLYHGTGHPPCGATLSYHSSSLHHRDDQTGWHDLVLSGAHRSVDKRHYILSFNYMYEGPPVAKPHPHFSMYSLHRRLGFEHSLAFLDIVNFPCPAMRAGDHFDLRVILEPKLGSATHIGIRPA